MKQILHYYPDITQKQQQQFAKLQELYEYWNSRVNVVSRKDINQLMQNHVLHSLGIAKVQLFYPNAKILDIGTGGGFPGIPLAILFPETSFYLVDSIGKKVKVVDEVVKVLGLTNVRTAHERAENINEQFDFIVSRAVTQMSNFVTWTHGKILKKNQHELQNGILYLKGGDLKEELSSFSTSKIYKLSDYFLEDFFETKKVVHLPLS